MSTQNDSNPNVPVVDKLRGYLVDEIEKLRTGQTTAASANAVTNAAGKYFQSIKLEIELCKVSGRTPRADVLGAVDQPALPAPKESNDGQ